MIVLWLAAAGGAGLVLIFLFREMVAWRRAKTLRWPEDLELLEQARIAGRYFRSHGIDAADVQANRSPFHLEIHQPPNRVLISFRNKHFKVTESFLCDSRSRLASEPHRIAVVVIANEMSAQEVLLAHQAGIPLVYPSKLGELCAMMNARSENLLGSLLDLPSDTARPSAGSARS